MALAETRKMAKPHYIVQRSRSGRFNFVLITDAGRFTGYVTTELDGRSNAELEQEAREKIQSLSETFAEVTGTTRRAEAESQIEEVAH